MPVLRVHFFYTGETASDFVTTAKAQVDKGNAFLRAQGANIQIERYPKDKAGTAIQGLGRPVISDDKKGAGDRLTLRDQCHVAEPNPNPPRVPVIFCRFDGTRDVGETVRNNWLPYILIDVKRAAPDGLTLLHEIGHCVGLRHPGDGSALMEGEDDNFMGYGQFNFTSQGVTSERLDRCGSYPWQITALRTAYFYG